MTAILIANLPSGRSNYLYLAAERRITADDVIISDNKKKIVKRTNGNVVRHYAMSGNVGIFDFMVEKLEQYECKDFPTLFFEDPILSTLNTSFGAFIVEQSPSGCCAYEVSIDGPDEKEGRSAIEHHIERLDFEELKLTPRSLGGGGAYVIAALKALRLGDEANSDSAHTDIVESFNVAASLVNSMNDILDIHRFKLPKKSTKKC